MALGLPGVESEAHGLLAPADLKNGEIAEQTMPEPPRIPIQPKNNSQRKLTPPDDIKSDRLLVERLTETYPAQRPQDQHHSHEIGRHNRIEQRTTRLWNLPPGAGLEEWHDHFCTLIEVHRSTEVFDTRQKHWVPRQETAYYLSTVALSAADAAQ